MSKRLVALTLVWCAVDLSGHIYACFGFDYQACQTFTQLYSGNYGQPLTCWMK